MATVTVKPNGDITPVGTWNIFGGPSSRYAAINNGTASPDDTDYIRSSPGEGSGGANRQVRFDFENMPADFDAITAVTGKVRHRMETDQEGTCQDGVKYQLFASDGATALSDEISLCVEAMSSSFRTDTLSFTRTGSTTKSTWHGVQIRVNHNAYGDGEDPVLDVSEIQLEITYSTATAPEIVMTGLDDENIADGDSSATTTDGTDFGTISAGGSTVTRTFKVTNTGDADLTLGTTSVPTGFTLTEGLDSTISASANDTFSVRLDNSVVGTKTGQISIENNDADEDPFNFTITGEVTGAVGSSIATKTNSLLRPQFSAL